VLVATGVLKESIEVKGYLPAKSFLGLFGGFDPMTWTRREGQTILEDSEGERALRISSASSKPGRIVVEGFTIKGGVLIEGSENAFARVKLARNQIINSPQSPGVEVRSNPGGQVHLVNDYISGNKGGVLSTETWLLVLNCTVVNNDGAGIKAPPGNVSARGNWTSSINNIVWTNSIDVVGFNTVMATICQGEPRCVPKNPALLNGSYRISPDSPARDAGISPLSQIEFLFDLEGQPRVVGPGLDLGAFEIQK
jgi:hypothetical protein